MSEPGVQIPPHRATILVGYGAFGLDVLRRFLASTASRGVLTWEESRGGAAPGERHLQDLALLWVPDRLGAAGQEVDAENALEGSDIEVMRDLYWQIERVGDGAKPGEELAAALATTAETLLSASARSARRGRLPLGLDVVVLARPTGPEVIGALDRLMVLGMDRLSNNANLDRAVQGAEALSYLEILDFENYWDRSDAGRRLRRAVRGSVEQWSKRRGAGRPAFGRFYFVDARTDDGIRAAHHRIDEISLFLEFLLFEGQRDGELQRLYQSQGKESPIATFGIRLMERSAGLLSHLAAARFGIGWLDYLVGTGPWREDGEPSRLRQRLTAYRPEALDELLEGEALRREVDGALAALEQELTAVPSELPDWPQRVRKSYEATVERLELRLAEKARARMAVITRDHLARLPEDLRAGIEADLHDPRQPVPLGAVVKELEEALTELQEVREVTAPAPGKAEELLRRVGELHSEYQRFNSDRVKVEGLRRWWPLLAVALSAGLTPVVHELLGDVPQPDPLKFLMTKAYEALRWIDNPLVLALLLFLATWGLGAWVLQRSIAARLERARRFYNDPERGRFVDRLRSGFKPGGALRAPIDAFLDRVLLDMAMSVRGEVTRELGRVLGRLKERRREMLWLREQLRSFLRMHGLTSEDFRPEVGRLIRDGTGIRHAVERGEDFENMLRSNPPGPERFRSTQAAQAPFAGWDRRYSDAFLYPLAFIDSLSRVYKDPFLQELAQPVTGPEQERRKRDFLEFLTQLGSFSLAFRWTAQQGVPPDRRYCLLPAVWQRLPGLLPALSDLRMSEESLLTGADVGRAYLLRLQTGVTPECLVEAE
jgi:hypothetical protein